MILIKLGGSVITEKARYRTFKKETVARLADEIARSGKDAMVVHGAGSFGHIVARESHLQEGFKDRSQIPAAARTMCDVRELSSMVVEEFLVHNIPAVSVPPGSCFIMDGGTLVIDNEEPIRRLAELGIMPVTFGDVICDRKTGFGIVSGDQCMEALCRMFDPEEVVFVSDVDGLYDRNPKTERHAKMFGTVTKDELDDLEMGSDVADVTGGIRGKMAEMLKMSSPTRRCVLINGNAPNRLYELLKGETVTCTMAKGGSG